MTWLTWRQFRVQTLTALAALAVLAVYLIVLGVSLRNAYDSTIVGCSADDSCSNATRIIEQTYRTPIGLVSLLLLAVPGVIGVFWGAPLVARELETGTHRLVWNQSVTRTRWLAVKIGLIGLISLAVTGLFSLLLTWAGSPFDQLSGNRFVAMNFGSRNIVPLGYALFAFVLGTTLGLLIRRTLPAMALTLTIFAVLQLFLMPSAIRPHLMSPVTATIAFDEEASEGVNGLGSEGEPGGESSAPMKLWGYEMPNAWVLSSSTPLLRADGSAFTSSDMSSCVQGTFRKDMACLAQQNLHFQITYHPGSRYWAFQWIESAVFLTMSLLLAALCFWRIRRT